jgi:ubiquinone/menaquinone biosynthesis C-methylase UbiE
MANQSQPRIVEIFTTHDLQRASQMTKDPYRNIARIYDRLFEPINKGLRLVGIRLFRPAKGMSILDVGCGTGAHLELYQRYQCNLYGLDRSAAMLEFAKKRLGDSASLNLGDATRMTYEDDTFDLVISMLALHEMSPETRSAVIHEMKRVLKTKGRILLIDFQPGPVQFLQGWVSKTIIILSELAAGREHFRNYRNFITHGGLANLLAQHDLRAEKQSILAGGTFNICLAAEKVLSEDTG